MTAHVEALAHTRTKLLDVEKSVPLLTPVVVIEIRFNILSSRDFRIDIEFTRHFLDRVNDARNRKQIEPEELEDMFAKAYEDHGEAIPKLGANAEAVLVDMESDINIPFVLKYDPRSKKLQLISTTVMRKPNFRTSNKRLTV